MPIFQRKIPPLWYVLYPSPSPSSTRPPTREGPFTRSTVAQLLASGRLSNGALIWTNERIFPNAEKPLSSRPVRIPEWRRLDQLPDPVVRELQAQAHSYTAAAAAAAAATVQADDPPPDPLTAAQMEKVQQHGRPTHPPPGGNVQAAPSPYPVGAFTAVGPEDAHFAAPAGYPAGTTPQELAPPPQHTPPTSPAASGHLPGVYPQPGVYPTGSGGGGAPP